jgi:biopolymer transport protein ExbD
MKLYAHIPTGLMKLNMTPMIDVVFQLLIFFMVVTEFANQQFEQVQLPVAPDAEMTEIVPPLLIHIRLPERTTPGAEIGSEAEVVISKEVYSIAKTTRPGEKSLKEFLKIYVQTLGGREPDVQVRADARAHYKFVQRVVYLISRSEIAKISFATMGKEREEN